MAYKNTETVYNIEVDDFHTYHIGRLGVWVHNDECCGAGNVILATEGQGANITGSAATIQSNGKTIIAATGEVVFNEGRSINRFETANKMTSRNLVSKKTEQNTYKEYSDTSIQSQIGGNQVFIQSGGDAHLTDTQVLADKDVVVQADGRLVVDAAKNTHITEQQNIVQKSGLVAVSAKGVTIGKQSIDGKNRSENQYHTGSTIAAIDGNVTLSAGESYKQVGSSVQAYSSDQISQSGNIDITAKTVDIINATDTQITNSDYKFKQSGISVSVSNPILDLAVSSHEIYQQAKKANDSRSDRLSKLAIAGNAWLVYSDYKEQKKPPVQLDNIDPKNPQQPHNIAKDFKIAVSVGTQSNESRSVSYQETNKASELKANNIFINATGNQNGNINIVGSRANANNNLILAADNEINILSSVQERYSQSANKNKSASIGVDFSVGANSGFGVTASGSVGRGNTDSAGKTHSNSHVTAGNALMMSSGDDTNIKGAVIKGEQVSLNVGGDFNLHSQQDTYNLVSKHRQYGGSVSAGAKTAPVSGSVNIGMDDSSLNYHGVQEQTMIQAGEGGFNINVSGNTDLRGSVIASQADKSKNQLITGSFTHEDITNVSEAKAKTRNYGVDSSVFSGDLYPIAKTVIKNSLGSTGDNHYDTSQTISAIAEGTLIAKDDDSQQRLDNITNDTTNTHRVIAPANIDEMMANVKARQFIKDATVDTVFKYSDEAHKKMFIEQAPLYRVTKDEQGNFVYTQIEGRDKENLLRQKNDRVHVFTNGIFNDAEAAGNYAIQNRREEGAELGQKPDLNDNPIYFVHFPKTNNFVSELMVAAYQKHLESDILGLTNATKEVKSLIQTYGASGLQLDGHSRGTLTITNAYSSLLNDGDTGKYANLRTNMVGAAANIKNADNKLAVLQGRDGEVLSTDPMNSTAHFKPTYTEAEKSEMSIHVQGHAADPIHGTIGFNSSTGGTTKPNNVLGIIKEAGRSILGKKTTAHNCYGVGKTDCGQLGLLKNNEPMKWEPIYKPKVSAIPTIQNLCKDLTDGNIQQCSGSTN